MNMRSSRRCAEKLSVISPGESFGPGPCAPLGGGSFRGPYGMLTTGSRIVLSETRMASEPKELTRLPKALSVGAPQMRKTIIRAFGLIVLVGVISAAGMLLL